MEILHLDEHLKQIEFGGQTLNVDEKFQLKLSLNKFQLDNKFDEFLFWGKISGTPISRP
jgi:radial spoke head protein 9